MNNRTRKRGIVARGGLVIALAWMTAAPCVATDVAAASLSPEMAALVENAGRGLSPGVQQEIRAFAIKHEAEGGTGPRHDGLPPGLEMILRRQAAGTYWNTSTTREPPIESIGGPSTLLS